MEISPILMARMLFVVFLFGVQAGVLFDSGRALRSLFFGELRYCRKRSLYSAKTPFFKRKIFAEGEKKKTQILKNICIFLFDFVWVIYSFLGIMLLNYSYNNGGIRMFTVLGFAVGFVIYYFTLSKLIVVLFEFVSFLIRGAFFLIFDTVRMPFLKIHNKLVKKLKKSFENIRFHIEKKRKKVYNVPEIFCENASSTDKPSRIKITVGKIGKKQKEGVRENEKN
jgi:hypothetical protein